MEGKELSVQDRAINALGLAGLRDELKALAVSTKNLIEITNEDGYKQIHAARMTLKNQRVEITRRGKTARDDANAFAKAVIAEEKALIGIIEPEESRLQTIQTEHDERIERQRQAAIEAETRRVEIIQDKIAELRGAISAVNSLGVPTPEKVQQFIDDVEAITVDKSFDEFEQQGHEAKASTLAMLREILAAANERKAEEARIAEERTELAKLRAADEKRQAEEAAKRQAAEAEERRKREAEEKKQREVLEAQRQKQAEEQKKIDAENKRLTEERAAIDKKEREQRASKAKAEAEAKKAKFPGVDAIVDVLCKHFDVSADVAHKWLKAI